MGDPLRPVGVRHSRPWSEGRRLWYEALEWMWPAAYCGWNRRFPDRHVVDRDTDIVVEGYPAASNSWVREVFRATQPGVKVASHLHSAAHVSHALRVGVPTVVLLRPPVDSIASLMARYPEQGFDPRTELRRYQRFYAGVAPLADRVLLVRFEDAVADPGAMIEAVNRKFATTFGPVERPDRDLREDVFSTLDRWSEVVAGQRAGAVTPRPSPARAGAAAEARAAVETADPARLATCRRLYDRLSGAADWRPAASR